MPFSSSFENELLAADFVTLDKEIKCEGYYIHGFGRLREMDGVTNEIVRRSLEPLVNRNQVFKSGLGSGASGSFFFFSHDKKFIIKTITDCEKSFFMQKFANNYFDHLNENPRSMLARIYGLYSVKISGLEAVNIVLMAHTLNIGNSDLIERVFDLKGSQVNRRVKILANQNH
jgi:hypothetical protein